MMCSTNTWLTYILSALSSQTVGCMASLRLKAVSVTVFCPAVLLPLQLTLCLTSTSLTTTARPSWLKHQQPPQQHQNTKSQRKHTCESSRTQQPLKITKTVLKRLMSSVTQHEFLHFHTVDELQQLFHKNVSFYS